MSHFVQLGFVGAHADVGGGYGENDGISDAALHWMMSQAQIAGMTFRSTYSNLAAPYQIAGTAHDSYVAPSGYGYMAISRNFPTGLKILIPQDPGTQALFTLYCPTFDVFNDTAVFSSLTPSLHLLIDPAYNLPNQFPNGWIGGFTEALVEQGFIELELVEAPEKFF